MHFVYLLYNIKIEKFYIGETTNIQRRYKEHILGRNRSTKFQCAYWKLVYMEIYRCKEDALKREDKLKNHGSGLVELKKRLKKSIEFKTGEGER